MIAFATIDGQQQDNKERSKIRFDKIRRRRYGKDIQYGRLGEDND